MDFDIQKTTRRCAVKDREFTPGEEFYSVLREVDGEIVREDFSIGAWEAEPDGCLGWWKSRMPEPDRSKVNWAPNDVMMHYFAELEKDDSKQDLRYILALLMIRRRIFKLEGSLEDEQGSECLSLFCSRNDQDYRVKVFSLGQARIEEIQSELSDMLFAE